MTIESYSLDDCLALTYQHPGLVIGSGVTSHVAAGSELRRLVCDVLAPSSIPGRFQNYYDIVDYVRQHHAEKADAVSHAIKQYFANIPPSPNVNHLIGGRWSLIVSLSPDCHFEDQLKIQLDRTPSSFAITLVTHPSIVPPANTLPVYKVLGNFRDVRPEHDLAVSKADLLRRRQLWRNTLRSVPDYLRDAPLFFAGTETQLGLVQEVLTELFASGPPYPSRLVLLQDDPILRDPTLVEFLSSYSKVVRVDATLREFCEATAAARPTRLARAQEAADLPVRDSRLAMVVEDYRSMIDLVPAGLPEGFDVKSHHLQLVDGLFRPTSLDWLPFLCDYDMRRSEVAEIVDTVATKKQYIDRQTHPFVIVKGEAGIGKTTTAKRVAVDLAKSGEVVLWCRKSHAFSSGGLRKLALSLREAIAADEHRKGHPVIVICDDPWGSRMSPLELIAAFETSGLPSIFLFFVRLTDMIPDGERLSFPGLPDEEITLQYQLPPQDVNGLKRLLIRVGAASDEDEATTKMSNMPTKNSDDAFCSLWYLLPQTHSQLSGSIHDEYGRLSIATAVKEYASKANDLGHQARLAYELVAVMSNLDIGLPLELLLRTTGASYDDWISSSREGEPLWGLLYDDLNAETGIISFYTRNEVVTRILLEIVNSGLGHAGEFQRLKQLVEACDVGSVPYRSFLVELLGRSRRKLTEILSYDQGVELYEIALDRFPAADRHLRFQYGLWKHHSGKDYVGAYSEFQRALDTPNYMYSARSESESNIHTSAAAAIVARVKEGTQDSQTGLNMVQDHLRQASNPRVFDPHSNHVFANLFYHISRRSREESEAEVTLEAYSESLRTIERTMQIIGAAGAKQVQYLKDIQAFEQLQGNILDSIGDVEETKQYASASFDKSRLQTGFEVVGRKLLALARRSNKGSDFKEVHDYLEKVCRQIENAGEQPSADLLALRFDVLNRWRLQQTRGEIDWSEIRMWLEVVVGSPKYRDDYLKLYYYAVALFQCGDYSQAHSVFEKLRTRIRPHERVRRCVRNYFVGAEGFPKRLQGTLTEAHGRLYVYSSELGTDVYVGRKHPDSHPGAEIHFYIAFTMEGPRAMSDAPDKRALLMP